MMRQTAHIGLVEHVSWFAARRRAGSPPYIAEVDGVPVGSGRLDIADDCAEFDVIVAPWARGHGYATPLIAALVREAAHCWGVTRCRAEVRQGNVASRAAFRRNGFFLVGTTPDYDVLERPC